jgi:hypothetical protein
MSATASHDPVVTGVGHETRDVRMGPIVWWGVGLLGLIAFTLVAMLLLMRFYDVREASESTASPLAGQYGLAQPPEPRLQTNAWQDLATFRAAEDDVLHSYGWVDQQAGVVRIPIDRAMQLLVQRRGAEAGR